MNIRTGNAPATPQNGYHNGSDKGLGNGMMTKPVASLKDPACTCSLPNFEVVSDELLTNEVKEAMKEIGVNEETGESKVNGATKENSLVMPNGFNENEKLLSVTPQIDLGCEKEKRLFLEHHSSFLGPEVRKCTRLAQFS